MFCRRRKMKKHQLNRLWDRMYLKFRAIRLMREKRKELTFRNRLAEKVCLQKEKVISQQLFSLVAPVSDMTPT
jgi:hypothetical protein